MHKDSAVARLQSAKEGSSILKKLGIDLLSSTINLGNLLGGRSIGAEIDFWTPDGEALNKLNSQELYELQSVTVESIYDEKPGKYMQPMPDPDGKNEKHREQWLSKILQYKGGNDKIITYAERFNNDSVGHIYVEPYYNKTSNDEKNGIKCYSIPFQFNAEISEGGIKAEYSVEKLLGRITDARYYISTSSDSVTIKTTYIATNMLEENSKIEDQYGGIRDRNNSDYTSDYTDLDSAWYKYWTLRRLAEIELKYRSLVFPMRDSDGYLVKPPIVQVYIGDKKDSSNPTIKNVLSYPIDDNIHSKDSSYDFTHTVNFSDSTKNENIVGGNISVKRYIVSDVKIEDIEGTNGWNYSTEFNFDNDTITRIRARRGFIVTLTLIETTRNFLDKIPDFKAYYDAFVNYDNKSNQFIDKEYVKTGFQSAADKLLEQHNAIKDEIGEYEKKLGEDKADGDGLLAQKIRASTDVMDAESTLSPLKEEYNEKNRKLSKAMSELGDAQKSGDQNLISKKQGNYNNALEEYNNVYGPYVNAKQSLKEAKSKFNKIDKEVKEVGKNIKALEALDKANEINSMFKIGV